VGAKKIVLMERCGYGGEGGGCRECRVSSEGGVRGRTGGRSGGNKKTSGTLDINRTFGKKKKKKKKEGIGEKSGLIK